MSFWKKSAAAVVPMTIGGYMNLTNDAGGAEHPDSCTLWMLRGHSPSIAKAVAGIMSMMKT